MRFTLLDSSRKRKYTHGPCHDATLPGPKPPTTRRLSRATSPTEPAGLSVSANGASSTGKPAEPPSAGHRMHELGTCSWSPLAFSASQTHLNPVRTSPARCRPTRRRGCARSTPCTSRSRQPLPHRTVRLSSRRQESGVERNDLAVLKGNGVPTIQPCGDSWTSQLSGRWSSNCACNLSVVWACVGSMNAELEQHPRCPCFQLFSFDRSSDAARPKSAGGSSPSATTRRSVGPGGGCSAWCRSGRRRARSWWVRSRGPTETGIAW